MTHESYPEGGGVARLRLRVSDGRLLSTRLRALERYLENSLQSWAGTPEEHVEWAEKVAQAALSNLARVVYATREGGAA